MAFLGTLLALVFPTPVEEPTAQPSRSLGIQLQVGMPLGIEPTNGRGARGGLLEPAPARATTNRRDPDSEGPHDKALPRFGHEPDRAGVEARRRRSDGLSGRSAALRFTLKDEQPRVVAADLCVYGGTSGGVVAAVQAARMGKRVALVEAGGHLGGMSSGGLGWTDFGSKTGKAEIGGLAREFYRRVGRHYGHVEEFTLEPHVAERVFDDWVKEPGVTLLLHQRVASVEKQGRRLSAVVMEDGTVVRASMFLDTTYEGDLMARAGVSFTLGREANAQYGETLNGRQGPATNPRAGKFSVRIDPYVVPGDPASGLLPLLLQPGTLGKPGTADRLVQSYNYRVCLTDRDANKRPLSSPADYDPADYELLARWIEARVARSETLTLSSFCKYDPLPNGKYDFNNRWPISTDYIGGASRYPEAGFAERKAIAGRHEDYLRGFFHFLATSPRVPETVRRQMQAFGLCKDEFVQNGGWPHQLYVREGRRLVSDFVMTQHHCQGRAVAPNSVGLAAYGIDIHAVRRIVHDGQPVNEGSNGGPVPQPYPIGYGSLVPKAAECENLYVTFGLSASHVAFGSIRMEPVFMVLSQSAATAACLAIDQGVRVQDLPYDVLRDRLLADGQVVAWPPAARPGSKK
jgi:ribulose 1,5-bisphosphate synthetase/thiazole synthase